MLSESLPSELDEAEDRRSAVAAEVAESEPGASRAETWASFELTVLDEITRSPVPGVYAEFRRLDDDQETSRITRATVWETGLDGNMAVEVQAEIPFDLTVRATGVSTPLWSETLEPLQTEQRRELVVFIDTGLLQRMYVRVVDDASGEPVAGARIVEVDRFGARLHTKGPLDFATWRDQRELALTEGDGTAELPRSRAVQKRFAALAEGYAPAVFEQSPSSKEREYAERIGLVRGVDLEVQLRDAFGHPVSDASVRFDTAFPELAARGLTRPMHGSLGTHSVSARSDATGRARFSNLPPAASYRLFVTAGITRWMEVPVEFDPAVLEPGAKAEIEIVLRPPSDVSGVAYCEGQPVAGAELLLRLLRRDQGLLLDPLAEPDDRLATTDASGGFRFVDVPAGDWCLGSPGSKIEAIESLEAPLPQERFVPIYENLEVDGEAGLENVRIDLERGSWITGRVLLSSGEEASGAFLRAELGESDRLWGSLNEATCFRIGPLPDAWVELYADHFEFGISDTMRVQPSEESVELVLLSTGYLSLRTVDAATSRGVPCSFEFRQHAADGRIAQTQEYLTYRPEVQERQLEPGTWSVWATGPNELVSWHGPIEIERGSRVGPIELQLESAGRLSLERAPEGSEEWPGVLALELRREGLVLDTLELGAGASEVRTVPPGSIDVVLFDAAGEELQRLLQLVLAGQSTSCRLSR